MSIQAFKQKFRDMTAQVENKEAECQDLRAQIREVDMVVEQGESDIASARRKIALLESQVAAAKERAEDVEAALQEYRERTMNTESARKQLEENESGSDEKLQYLEQAVLEAKHERTDKECQYEEIERKRVVIQRDINKLEAKNDRNERRVENLLVTLDRTTDGFKSMETREGEIGENQEVKEEKIRNLKGQLSQVSDQYDDMHRHYNSILRDIETTRGEIQIKQEKYEQLEQEINSFDDLVADM